MFGNYKWSFLIPRLRSKSDILDNKLFRVYRMDCFPNLILFCLLFQISYEINMTSFGDLHLSVHDDGGNMYFKQIYMFCLGHCNLYLFKYTDKQPEKNIAGQADINIFNQVTLIHISMFMDGIRLLFRPKCWEKPSIEL